MIGRNVSSMLIVYNVFLDSICLHLELFLMVNTFNQNLEVLYSYIVSMTLKQKKFYNEKSLFVIFIDPMLILFSIFNSAVDS